LAPRRQFGYGIRDHLNDAGTPAHSFFHEEALDGNPKVLTESQAQQAFELLTLLADPEDCVALRCWCGFGNNSLSRPAWSRLRAHCSQTGESPRSALERLAAGALQLPYTGALVARYRLLEGEAQRLRGLRGNDLLNAVLPAGQQWAETLRSIAESIEEPDFDTGTLRDALRSGITQPELPTDVDYVRIMSLHKSKGLTADLVVVVGCIAGLIPFIQTDLAPADQERSLEEQRRLFYVAITRARQSLVLSSSVSIPRDLAHRMRVPIRGGGADYVNTIASRFLSELGPARSRPVAGEALIR
jgi:superfamily I DNA/RNA helicase